MFKCQILYLFCIFCGTEFFKFMFLSNFRQTLLEFTAFYPYDQELQCTVDRKT